MTDAAKKLLIKPGSRVLVLARPAGVALATTGKAPYDVVIAFARDAAAVAKVAPRAARALGEAGVLWLAYPKTTSGIATDLTRDRGWDAVHALGLVTVSQVAIDATWSALRFRPAAETTRRPRAMAAAPAKPPRELLAALGKTGTARTTWDSLAPSHVREYVQWIEEAKKPETRARRIAGTLKLLAAGQRDRNAKYRSA